MNKYFVTGGSGFIGSNFIHNCLIGKHQIFNYDLLTIFISIHSVLCREPQIDNKD